MKRLGSFSFLLLISLIAFCQKSSTISGKVIDNKSNGIPGASVSILNTNRSAITDSAGNFSLNNISAGDYIIEVTAIGYAATDNKVKLDAQHQSLSITLEASAVHLDAVVVTADKKEELVQQVPYSISAITSKQVQEYRIWNSKDITAIVPNLYSANPGDQRNVTSIRGIVSSSYDPAVATYIDGVNQFSLDTYIAQLFDVDRIEVLRGPQGTLYGRNAMGGVINIITRQPTNHTDGYAEISVGNYGQQRYSVGIRTPIVKDKLFLNVAGTYDGLDGFYTNVYNNTKFDKQHSITGNYALKWLASRQWTVGLNVKYQYNRNNGVFPLASSKDDAFAHPYEVNQNAITKIIDNTLNASLSVLYAGNGFNFSSQTAFQSNYRYYTDPIDGDFSPIDGITIINNYGKPWNDVKVWTQEFKFTSPASSSSKLKWTTGVYLFYQDNPNKQATRFGRDAAFVGSPDSLYSIITSSKSKRLGIAFYGQATYSITDKLDVIAGLRYDYEYDKLNVLGQYQHDPDPNPVFDTQPDTTTNTSFSAFSPKLGLSYHFDQDHNLYVTYSRGFRPGGLTQLGPDPSQPPLYAYQPEFSNNIEAGIKNTFLQNRVRLNVALFYSNITNAQVPTLVLPSAITVTKNAGRLDSRGVELEFAAKLLKELEAEYNFGYTHATYQTLKLSQNGSETDLAGKRQIFTPDVTSTLALQYSYPLGNKQQVKLVVRGEWIYLGAQYFDLANTIVQNPYSLFNTRFGVATKHVDIMFWCRNIGDQKYVAYAYDFGAVHLGNPRTLGVTLTARL
ncbi:MAG: TonB-dependent receptor [Bacteroidetes bacterium]|nr:TonB-dependent receptor [Bacteroidota bacterium]